MSNGTGGKPTAFFKIAVALVVLGLLALGVTRAMRGRGGEGEKAAEISRDSLGMMAEAPDGQASTTVQEYSYVPGQRLPEVRGVSAYQALRGDTPTVRMALNVWAGWA